MAILSLAAILSVLAAATLRAAPRAYWSIRPVGATEAARGWRVFGGGISIEVDLSVVADEESTTAIVLQPGFFRSVSIELISTLTGRVAGTVREWPARARCPVFETCPVDEPIVLEPMRLATMRATLTSIDGRPFPDGDYELRLGLAAARGLAHGRDGGASGPLFPPDLSLPLGIRRAATADERLTHVLNLAADAVNRQDYAAALALYEKSGAPDDPVVRNGSSIALIALKRFREAAAILERQLSLPGAREPGSPVSTRLAFVYFALGEDKKAEDVIRRHFPLAAVAETIGWLKAAGVAARSR